MKSVTYRSPQISGIWRERGTNPAILVEIAPLLCFFISVCARRQCTERKIGIEFFFICSKTSAASALVMLLIFIGIETDTILSVLFRKKTKRFFYVLNSQYIDLLLIIGYD